MITLLMWTFSKCHPKGLEVLGVSLGVFGWGAHPTVAAGHAHHHQDLSVS